MSKLTILIVFAVLALLMAYPVGRLVVIGMSRKPDHVGSGTLVPCDPNLPRCVSSINPPADEYQHIEPLTYTGTQSGAQTALLNVLQSMERITLMTNTDGYVHAERRSPAWRFIDDLEFVFDDEAKVIQVRAGARLGYGDMYKNREHIEEIRSAFDA